MEKIIWETDDTFASMHEKISKLEGRQVKTKKGEPVTIFKVGEIKKITFENIIYDGSNKMMCGDSTGAGFGVKEIPMWSFVVDFGKEDKKGNRMTIPYNFAVPRTRNKKKDVEQTLYDPNHPFVFYQTENGKS